MRDPEKIMLAATTVACLGGVLAGGGFAVLRARSENAFVKGLCIAGIIVVALLTPFVQDFTLMKLNQPDPSSFAHTFIDPGPVTSFTPIVITIFAAIIFARATARGSRAT